MRIPLLFVLLVTPSIVMAQSGDRSSSADTVFLRAQRLVNEGQGDVGRRLVDSVLAGAREGTPQYAEALYWRAALAPTAAEAERDYRRLTVEYPLSRHAEDALVALAQLEIARRDYAMAMRHLDRVKRDFPSSPALPRAYFLVARAHLEQGDLPRGCASLASARATTPRSNVEMHNQLDFHAQRCLGVDTGVVAGEASTTVAAVPPSDAPTRQQSAPPSTSTAKPPASSAAPPAGSAGARPPSSASPPPPSASPPASSSPPARATPSGVQYTVQIAALNARGPADELRDKLRARGYDARVVGAGQLFRVRIGRYPTREEAAAVAADLRQKGISRDAWVAEAEAR